LLITTMILSPIVILIPLCRTIGSAIQGQRSRHSGSRLAIPVKHRAIVVDPPGTTARRNIRD